VELYGKVRLARREGRSERPAALHFGVSRASVKKMMGFSVPPGYQRTAHIKRPKLDAFAGFIDQWLLEDLGRNRSRLCVPPCLTAAEGPFRGVRTRQTRNRPGSAFGHGQALFPAAALCKLASQVQEHP